MENQKDDLFIDTASSGKHYPIKDFFSRKDQ
jgi:hypothetical protein